MPTKISVISSMAKKRPVRIRERKLGRYGKRNKKGKQIESVHGLWWENNLIEVDPRQTPLSYFKTLIHELLHAALPNLSEREVVRVTNIIARNLWKQNYRKNGRLG